MPLKMPEIVWGGWFPWRDYAIEELLEGWIQCKDARDFIAKPYYNIEYEDLMYEARTRQFVSFRLPADHPEYMTYTQMNTPPPLDIEKSMQALEDNPLWGGF